MGIVCLGGKGIQESSTDLLWNLQCKPFIVCFNFQRYLCGFDVRKKFRSSLKQGL